MGGATADSSLRTPRVTNCRLGRRDEAARRWLLADSGSEPGVDASRLVKEPAARVMQHTGRARSRVGWALGRDSAGEETADIRLSGIYPLLGPISTGRTGGQADNGEEPTQARYQRCRNGAETGGHAGEMRGWGCGEISYVPFFLECEGSGDVGCLGDAEMVT